MEVKQAQYSIELYLLHPTNLCLKIRFWCSLPSVW